MDSILLTSGTTIIWHDNQPSANLTSVYLSQNAHTHVSVKQRGYVRFKGVIIGTVRNIWFLRLTNDMHWPAEPESEHYSMLCSL